uniref:Uncharacterized protein n=1 Tax=Candidatus Kentrum sp. FM TaxID=2126340 RepID=A0A450TLN4_9GAMM|nr:MAG: hypothetical protein BECKFM1743C_GA0114222_104774 [Candidatus Kentron sp. FM]VFJ68635.1 MAG: hypothetical protein BECKFM1743A_GA0114220_104784 [Candidatus Kentron sp. FM]VFK16730.1 MAG: hypothetical protein BECKFM1743B_GA0114221_104394 [Candidatus Kentron sp. FM]
MPFDEDNPAPLGFMGNAPTGFSDQWDAVDPAGFLIMIDLQVNSHEICDMEQ